MQLSRFQCLFPEIKVTVTDQSTVPQALFILPKTDLTLQLQNRTTTVQALLLCSLNPKFCTGKCYLYTNFTFLFQLLGTSSPRPPDSTLFWIILDPPL